MKTLKFIGQTLFFITLCICFSACGEDSVVPEVTIESGSEDYFVKNMDFGSISGEKIFSFTSNVDWSISLASTRNGESWCSVIPSSGSAGTNTVRICVQENTGYDDRNVVLTLTAGSLTKNLTITQKQKDALLLTTNKFELEPIGGEINVEVKANVEYEAVIPEAYKDWITLSSRSRGLENSNLTFDIAETDEYDKREGEIIIKSGEFSETVHVYQTGQAVLLLTQNEYPVSDKGATIAVEVKSNFTFDVQMPDVDWIAEDTESRGVSSHTLYYKIALNESEDSRQAEIVYLDKNSSIKDTLRIVQAPKGALVISQKVYEVTAESEMVKVEFNTNINIEYSILDNCEWVKPVEDSRALKQYELFFYVDENWSGAERTAKIVLFDSLVGMSDTIVVNQATIPDNEIWYKTNDGLVWPISEYEMPGMLSNTYANGKGIVLCNDVITEIKDNSWGAASDQNQNITDVVLPKTLEYIGCVAFSSTSLTKVTIPANVKTIGNNAFCNCMDLESIVFYNGLETIDYSAFHSCERLKTITFPASLQSLNSSAFNNCTALETICVDDNNPYFSSLDGVLYDKKQNTLIKCPIAKENIEIPLTVTTIGESAFFECKYLKEIIIPASVVTIESWAFSYCSLLKEIVIPMSVKFIGEAFISECEMLDAIVVDNSNLYYSSLDGVLYNKDYTSLLSCPISKSNVSIPSSVKVIANSAFRGCGNLEAMELPDNLEVIGDYAFGNCDSIKNIKIPDKVTTIGNSAFEGCI